MENQTGLVTAIIIGCLAMFCLIIVIILFVVTYQRKMLLKENRIKIIEQEKQLDLFKASVEAEEQQKEKIARNLHDEINPLLNALKFSLTKHRIRAGKNEFHPDEMLSDERTLDKAIEGIRTTCLDLIPTFLLQNGLVPSLEDYISSIRKLEGMTADFESNSDPELVEKFSTQELLNIYRVCLEIANNTFKHAKCSFFKIVVNTIDGFLTIDFIHNGKGVTNEEMEKYTDTSTGLGLKSLKARALILNAKIDYSKNINTASVKLSIPFN